MQTPGDESAEPHTSSAIHSPMPRLHLSRLHSSASKSCNLAAQDETNESRSENLSGLEPDYTHLSGVFSGFQDDLREEFDIDDSVFRPVFEDEDEDSEEDAGEDYFGQGEYGDTVSMDDGFQGREINDESLFSTTYEDGPDSADDEDNYNDEWAQYCEHWSDLLMTVCSP